MANLSIFKNLVNKDLLKRVKTADIEVDRFIDNLCDSECYTVSHFVRTCIVEHSLSGVILTCDDRRLLLDCEFLRFGMESGEFCNFYEWQEALRFVLSELQGRGGVWQS